VRVLGRAVPLWAALLGMYTLSRALSTGLLLIAWLLPHHRPPAYLEPGPGFAGFLTSWDALWYREIALHGYPQHLPLFPNGDVSYNAWAFFPVFPTIVRGLMTVTGLSFEIAGPLVATFAGGAAVFAIHRVVRMRFGTRAAWWGAVFFAFGPMAWLLQLAYAESLFLFLIFCALVAMMRRRYLLMIPFAVLASFTHPGALALGAALAIKAIVRLVRRQPIRWHHWAGASAAIVVIVAAGLAWPIVAAGVTGDPSAYFDTEFAWWQDFIGRALLIPFSPAFLLFQRQFGVWGVLLVAVVLATFIAVMASRAGRRLGTDLWAFVVAYIGYLAGVFLPTQSLFRMLMPLSPLFGHPVFTGTTTRRWISLAAGVLLQLPAIELLWVAYPP
jgi:hypothetical protein